MQALRYNKQRFISLKKAKQLIIVLVFVLLFDFLLFPLPVMASELVETPTQEFKFINNLPENSDKSVGQSGYYTITAYNSEVGQTDNSPCITANGFNLCEHGVENSVAANFLQFNTAIRIPELFGDRVFIVRDRMNARYSDRLDIWMLDKGEARQFGVKVAKIEILE